MIRSIKNLYFRVRSFAIRQPANFKLMLLRRPLHGLALNLSVQYNSIYATLLGANPVQLGGLQSAGNAVGALVSFFAGWFIDRHSLKKTFLASTLLLVTGALLFSIAPHWSFLFAAIIFLRVGIRTTCTSCTVNGARELSNQERATGRGVCQTLTAVVALVTPLVAAWLVFVSGGIAISGLRSLYLCQVVIFIGLFFLLLFRFKEPQRTEQRRQVSLFAGLGGILKSNPAIIRFLLMIALMEIPWTMVSPFMPLFAHQVKGADEFILGALGTVRFFVPFVFAIPIGRLADRHGRKKILLALAPLTYLSNLLLILASGPKVLLLAAFFFGFYGISTAVVNAMAAEMVPKEQMGRWIGVLSLVRGAFSIPLPILAGGVWNAFGPVYVFVAAIFIDLLLRIPLLLSVPETLSRPGPPTARSDSPCPQS